MKKLIIFLFLLFYTFSSAQDSIYIFPDEQIPYIGGYEKFYKDFNSILIEKNFAPCENKKEYYQFAVLIKPDKKINFVADTYFDELNSKCAKNLSREVAKYLTGWNPALIDGEIVSAVANFYITPIQLFGTLEKGYNPNLKKEVILPEFPGGINEFRNQVANRVDLSRYTYDKTFRLEITFVVERDGTIGDTKLLQSSGLKDFDNMVLAAVSKIRKKWKPANVNGFPVRYLFRIPLAFASPTN